RSRPRGHRRRVVPAARGAPPAHLPQRTAHRTGRLGAAGRHRVTFRRGWVLALLLLLALPGPSPPTAYTAAPAHASVPAKGYASGATGYASASAPGSTGGPARETGGAVAVPAAAADTAV